MLEIKYTYFNQRKYFLRNRNKIIQTPRIKNNLKHICIYRLHYMILQHIAIINFHIFHNLYKSKYKYIHLEYEKYRRSGTC